MATAMNTLDILTGIVRFAAELQKFPDSVTEPYKDDLFGAYEILDAILCTPRCDICGAVDETVDWCGGCGCCTEHCQLDQACEDFATEMLELMQDGD